MKVVTIGGGPAGLYFALFLKKHDPSHQVIVAAVDGVCAGAGAILAMASDLRFGTARGKVAFLFARAYRAFVEKKTPALEGN